jgi:hypothetical protein
MLPKWHVLTGFLFAYVIYGSISLTFFQVSLIFLASIFIDFDHYIWYIHRKKDWSLKNAYDFLKEKKHLRTMMIFHTIEFHILIALLIFVWGGFLYILIGMIFHSVLDIIDMSFKRELKNREFSLIEYLARKLR